MKIKRLRDWERSDRLRDTRQAGNLFRLLTPDAQIVFAATSQRVSATAEKRIEDLQINHFYERDQKCREGVARKMGRKIEGVGTVG